MSYRVMIILEDYVKDQYIVKPLIDKFFSALGRTKAKVVICKDPRFRGITDCMNQNNLVDKVIKVYREVDLFLLIVDRDKEENRHHRLSRLESIIREYLRPDQHFLTAQAYQEVEVWAMAGHQLPKRWKWVDIRDERDPKEKYFVPFSRQKGYYDYPDEGRKKLMEESLNNWSRVIKRCQEDIEQLLDRIKGL